MASWDRSHEYVVHRTFHERTQLTIHFAAGAPTVAELVAVRKCLPNFGNMNPSAFRALIGDTGSVSLGVLETRQAREIVKWAPTEGLKIVAENASFVTYRIHDVTLNCTLPLADEGELQSIAEAMIAAGVLVSTIEA
jgi:hypothetical protein